MFMIGAFFLMLLVKSSHHQSVCHSIGSGEKIRCYGQFCSLHNYYAGVVKIDLFHTNCTTTYNQAVSLTISSSSFSEIPMEILQEMPNLIVLTAKQCRIEHIQPELFDANNTKNLAKLKFLKLSSNHIKKLNAITFAGANQLVKLQLDDNRITEIHQLAFEGLTQLEELDLEYNELVTLDWTVLVPVTSLKELDVRNCKLEHIASLTESPALTTMGLSRNFLKEIPNISQQTSLENLDLSRNKELKMDLTELAGMTNLSDLTLNNLPAMNLTSIDVLPKLPNLLRLYLKQNNLVQVSGVAHIHDMFPNLVLLSLEYNHISCDFIRTYVPMAKSWNISIELFPYSRSCVISTTSTTLSDLRTDSEEIDEKSTVQPNEIAAIKEEHNNIVTLKYYLDIHTVLLVCFTVIIIFCIVYGLVTVRRQQNPSISWRPSTSVRLLMQQSAVSNGGSDNETVTA